MRTLPQVYDVLHLDHEGGVINEERSLQALSPDVPRELQFEATATAAGAADYKVRLMRPAEVKAHFKAERRAERIEYVTDIAMRAFRMYGIPDLMAYLDQRQELLH